MPEPTTRRGRYLKRRARYAARARRQRISYPYEYVDAHGNVILNHGSGPWVFAGDGSQQQSLHHLLVHPTHGTWPPDVVFHRPFHVTTSGQRKTPHPTFDVPWVGPSHQPYRILDWHNRSVNYKGHKLDRMNGFDRKCWAAYRFARKWHQQFGTWGWPSWDPQGREPVVE